MSVEGEARAKLSRVFSGVALETATAIVVGDHARVRQLTEGAVADSVGAHGVTLVHIAVRAGDAIALEILLTHGASPIEPDESGMVPIHYAATGASTEITLALLSAGADPDATVAQTGDTALLLAIRAELRPQVDALLGAGADASLSDTRGYAPVHYASLMNRPELVLALLQFGADPQARSPQGKTFQDYLWTTPDNFYRGEAKAARLAVRRWLELNGIPVVGGAAR